MASTLRWTSADLAALPDDGKRYEIIDGDLFVSKQPHLNHQHLCTELVYRLSKWNEGARLGFVFAGPGLILAEDDDVVPDVVWISSDRLRISAGQDGKLHTAPELAIEVLSPGTTNERRDRDAKQKLYSRRGVQEYWIVSWLARQIEVYRRDAQLHLSATLLETDILESPQLPGFSCPISALFENLPLGE